jgi:threonine dehydrogenase-like Zn-dependent dehydrogenase
VAVHDVRRAAVKSGDRVLVLGGGPIGALIGLVCTHLGAGVVVSEVNPFRIDFLQRRGLRAVGPDTDLIRHLDEWTGGEGVDVAFEVTGNPKAVVSMTEAVRVWGTVSVVAIHAEPMPVRLYDLFAREITVHGSRLYARRDWEEAIGLAASGAVQVGPFVSRKIPLEALQDGMQEALAGGPVMKVLVDLTA